MDSCIFCQLHLEPTQNIILENDHCLFLQGAGVIVPKRHAETVFDLTADELQSTSAPFLGMNIINQMATMSDGIVMK